MYIYNLTLPKNMKTLKTKKDYQNLNMNFVLKSIATNEKKYMIHD